MALTYPNSPAIDENIGDSIARIAANFTYLDENLTSASSEIHSATRGIDTASGSVVYNLTGAIPRAIIAYAIYASTGSSSWGFCDEDLTEYCIYGDYNSDIAADTSNLIDIVDSAGTGQSCTVSAMTTNQFTLDWTKTGATANAGNIQIIFLILF